MRPRWLGYGAARQKILHHGLDVQNWGAVDCVQTAYFNGFALDRYEATNGGSDAVWAVFATLGENTNQRPVLIVTGVARTSFDFIEWHFIEMENDFYMAEILQTRQSIGRKIIGEDDFGMDFAPIIVNRRTTA